MAIKKLKAASPDKLLNKGADMKPVTTGQVNNQLIPSIDTDIDANGRLIKDNTSKIDLNTTAVAPLAGIAKGVFTTCAAAVSPSILSPVLTLPSYSAT